MYHCMDFDIIFTDFFYTLPKLLKQLSNTAQCCFMFDVIQSIIDILFQLLCLIGEAFEDLSDDICGATMNIRNRGDKLGLWTRDAKRGDAIVRIGYVSPD